MTVDFADYGGWVSLPPAPDVGKDTEFYAIALPAEQARCQDFLDRSYNKVAGRLRFRVMLDHVFLTVVRAGSLSVARQPYAAEGTISETDIGFWMLAGSYAEGALLPDRIAWVPACLFVDNPFAAAAGREVWGFPKYCATIVSPSGQRNGGPFDVSALAIRQFGVQEHASLQQVLSVSGSGITFVGLDVSAAETFRLLCVRSDHSLLDEVLGHVDAQALLGSRGLSLPVFYLKQFRSADDPTIACYQTLLSGPLTLDRLRAFGLLRGDWQVELHGLDSLPFVRDLGLGELQGGKLVVTAEHVFWCDMDFTVGSAVAMAPTM